MAQYEADKIIRLIQLCCWKKKCEMNPAGFKQLHSLIDAKVKPGKPAPKERYLSDLVSDASNAAKGGNLIGKNAEYINTLLTFAGFNSWISFTDHLSRISNLIHAQLDLSAFSEAETAVCFPGFLQDTVFPEISAVRKTAVYPVKLIPNDAVQTEQLFELAGAQFGQYPFVVCIIPLAWKDQLTDEHWKKLMASRRILPVWLDEAALWEVDQAITGIAKPETLTGLTSLLLGIQHIDSVIQQCHDPTPTAAPPTRSPENQSSKRVETMSGNQGTFFLGDIQIHGKNISMKEINQTIHNNKYKKS